MGIFDSQIDQAVDKAFAKQLENLANSTAALQMAWLKRRVDEISWVPA